MNFKTIAFNLGVAGAVLTIGSCKTEKKESVTKPNIIYILADDLGYGDLSCYGQTKFSTPNIDKLASQGMLFTQHYSGSTVCAPSRSALLTGFHTGQTPIRGNMEVQPEGQAPMPASSLTVAEVFKEAGYTTGAFGKWGLGYPGSEGDPNMQGFDEFFGYNCQRIAHHYYPYHLYHNQEKVILEGNKGDATGTYAPLLIHEKTLDFIDQNKDKPFFLFVPSLIPHAEMFAPEEYMEKFRGKFDPENSYKGLDDVNDSRFRQGPYGSQAESHAAFVAMVTLLDDQVGEIMDKVKELGLEENTIIMFTSDNGPHREGGANPDFFNSNGIYKGYKRDLYEGGIRVPFIVSWKGKIEPGTTSGHVSAFWDMLPTFTDLAGIETPKGINGLSMASELLGEEGQASHEYLYWEFHEGGGKQAVLLRDKWKGIRLQVKNDSDGHIELYNLMDDPGEQNDISDKHPDIVKEINTIMTVARTPSENFNFGMKTVIE